ncbi:MAG: heparin lyase I family protein [Actinobacteria bacterium]|nr:heparin lyase I family protein [Actinomycetota bacterium]
MATSIAGTATEERGASKNAVDSRRACPLAPTETIGAIPMEMPSCLLVASDTSSNPNEGPFWGELQCAAASRYEQVTEGGDPSATAAGTPQDNADFRRLTVLNGDNFYGARCELGENNNQGGPTVFYHQGEHLVTYFSEKLPANFPLDTKNWQTVMQMKQAQPSDGGGGAPILEMEAREGRWIVDDNWHELWSTPARTETWTRFAWDVYYSQDPNQGWLQVSVDLDGDGDFNDPGERSPVFHVATLKTEIEGPNGASDGLVAGQPIPSHLRMGIYHDPTISCPAPTGCSVDVDNVQVFAPAPLDGG